MRYSCVSELWEPTEEEHGKPVALDIPVFRS